jgi:methionine-rich copper-binding protein CopC
MRSLRVGDCERRLGVLIVGLAAVAAAIQTVGAHAHVITSTPAAESDLAGIPPDQTLKFDSPLADSGNQILLYRSDHSAVEGLAPHQVPGKDPTLQTTLPPLVPDVYTVAWTSVSAEDGHTLSQFYAFTVGPIPPAKPAPDLPPLKVGDTTVKLRFGRGDIGPTTIDAAVTDAKGNALTNLQRVIFRYQPVGLKLGEDEIVAPAKGSNARTPSFTLGLIGSWQFEVIVRRAGLDDVSTTTHISLSAAPVSTTTAAGPTAAPTQPALLSLASTRSVPSPTSTSPAAMLTSTTLAPSTRPSALAPASPTIIQPTVTMGATPTIVPPATPAASIVDGKLILGIVVVLVLVTGGIVALRQH